MIGVVHQGSYEMNRKTLLPWGVSLLFGATTVLLACERATVKQSDGGTTEPVEAVAGSQVGKGSVRPAANFTNSLLIAWTGSEIGKQLDERDRMAAEQATEEALNTGREKRWTNSESGNSGYVQVGAVTTELTRTHFTVLKGRVSQISPLTLIGKDYEARTGSRIRSGPGTEYKIVGSLGTGDVVRVVGGIDNKPWYLISQDGVGTGFVHMKLLQPTQRPASTSRPAGEVVNASFESEQVCRTTEQSIGLADGRTETKSVKACKQQDGSWKAAW